MTRALGVAGALLGAVFASDAAAQTEILVRGSRPARDVTAVSVGADEAAAIAGTEGDPVQAVYDLPGVARPELGTGQLVVWGSASQDTRTYVDGVEVPALFHGGALRSTVSADLVRGVTLVPGGYGVEYGRGLGGVVRVETRDLSGAGVHGDVAADTLDGSAMVEAAIGDRVHVALAGRYGWLDPVLRAVDPSAEDGSPTSLGAFFPIPHYDDYQAKLQIDLRSHEALEAVLLGSHDDLTQTIADPDPSLARSETTSSAFQRVYVRYRRALDDGAAIEILPWVGHDASALDAAFGPVPASARAATWRGGLRASHHSRPLPWLAATLGVEIDETSSNQQRAGSLEIPPREGDITVFGEPPGPDVNADAWTAGALDVAPHAQLDIDAGPVSISPGLRVDGYLLGASRATPRAGDTPALGLSQLDATVEPRVAVRARITPRFTALAAAGTYSQPPAPADMSAVFGNPALGPATADHATLGERLLVTDSLSLEATGFVKWMANLTARNPAPSPPLAQALVADGAGRSYGLTVLVRQRLWRGFSGWVAYTIGRSERRDAPGASWRLFDEDEPQVLAAVATQQVGPWTFSARLRASSGLPRTPVIGAFYDAKDNLYEPLFGPQNSTRLPAFWQLDARVDRAFGLGDARLHLYVEGLNVTDHANVEEFTYSTDYTQRGTLRGLPIVAVIGARGEL